RLFLMEPVWHRRFSGCSLARHALQHGANATSPARADSVLLRAVALPGAHHTVGATEEIVLPSGRLAHPFDFFDRLNHHAEAAPSFVTRYVTLSHTSSNQVPPLRMTGHVYTTHCTA